MNSFLRIKIICSKEDAIFVSCYRAPTLAAVMRTKRARRGSPATLSVMGQVVSLLIAGLLGGLGGRIGVILSRLGCGFLKPYPHHRRPRPQPPTNQNALGRLFGLGGSGELDQVSAAGAFTLLNSFCTAPAAESVTLDTALLASATLPVT